MNCKKVCIVMLSIVLALVFSSCSDKTSESDFKMASTVGLSEYPNESVSEVMSTENNSEATSESAPKETTADNFNKGSAAESIEAPQGYHSFVDSVEAKSTLAYSQVDIPATINDAQVSCVELIDKSKVLVLLYKENVGNVDYAEYGIYDFDNHHYKTLFKCDQKQDYEIVTLDEDYIVLRMSDNNWTNTSTYLYSIRENALKKIFDNEKDTETGADVIWREGNVVIEDNKIWLDKYYYDETNTPSVDVLSYDCATGVTTTVKKHAKNPMLYRGEVVFFVRDAKGEYRRLETLDGDLVCNIKAYPIRAVAAEDIYCFEKKNENSQAMDTQNYIKDLIHDTPLFYTERYIGWLAASDAFVSWRDFDVSVPCIYSVKNQCMLVFSELEQADNVFHIKDNYGLLSSYRNGKMAYYFFSEE